MLLPLLIKFVTRAYVLLQLVLMVNSGCICNEPGTDGCLPCSGATIVRPKPKYVEPSLELPPIGDNCWCSKLLIEPAVLPKTCGKPKPSKTQCECSSNAVVSYDSGSLYNNLNYNYMTGHKPKDDSPPADPISVSLAIQAGKAIGVPEAKLAYGFVQKPIDALQKIFFSSVPEENLYKLKSDVITLKKRPVYVPPEDEFIDDIEEDEVTEDEEVSPQLTYKQLGYVAEQFKNPKFRRLTAIALPAYKHSSGLSVDCTFRPGSIVPYKNKKRTKSTCY